MGRLFKEDQMDLIGSLGDCPDFGLEGGFELDDVPVIGQSDRRSDHIYVPFMGPSTNSIYAGVHWSKRNEQADEGHLAVKTIRIEPFSKPVRLTFIPIVGKGGKVRDCSNYSYTAKIIEDGLVKAGILKDDTPDWVKGFEVVEPHIDRKQQSGMWVYIEEISEWDGARWLLDGNRYPWDT